jgi:hypothetical protein
MSQKGRRARTSIDYESRQNKLSEAVLIFILGCSEKIRKNFKVGREQNS